MGRTGGCRQPLGRAGFAKLAARLGCLLLQACSCSGDEEAFPLALGNPGIAWNLTKRGRSASCPASCTAPRWGSYCSPQTLSCYGLLTQGLCGYILLIPLCFFIYFSLTWYFSLLFYLLQPRSGRCILIAGFSGLPFRASMLTILKFNH